MTLGAANGIVDPWENTVELSPTTASEKLLREFME
jgi:hypothetical protein